MPRTINSPPKEGKIPRKLIKQAVQRAKRKRKKADAILTADIHITDRGPVCRDPEEFHDSMFRKLDFIRELQQTHGNIPCFGAGDIFGGREVQGGRGFGGWKQPPWILREAITRIDNWVVIPGQHDLPQHRLEAYPKSALAVLEAASCVVTLPRPVNGSRDNLFPVGDRNKFQITGFPWGIEPRDTIDREKYDYGSGKQIALVHKLVYVGKPPFPGAKKEGSTAKTLLRKMKGFDLIVTGDNHETFVFMNHPQNNMPILVNPGSMMRTTADQADHEPCVFLWYAKDNSIERVILPHKKGVVNQEHIVEKNERDERLEAFVQRLPLKESIETPEFRKILRQLLASDEIEEVVKQIIWEAVDNE